MGIKLLLQTDPACQMAVHSQTSRRNIPQFHAAHQVRIEEYMNLLTEEYPVHYIYEMQIFL